MLDRRGDEADCAAGEDASEAVADGGKRGAVDFEDLLGHETAIDCEGAHED